MSKRQYREQKDSEPTDTTDVRNTTETERETVMNSDKSAKNSNGDSLLDTQSEQSKQPFQFRASKLDNVVTNTEAPEDSDIRVTNTDTSMQTVTTTANNGATSKPCRYATALAVIARATRTSFNEAQEKMRTQDVAAADDTLSNLLQDILAHREAYETARRMTTLDLTADLDDWSSLLTETIGLYNTLHNTNLMPTMDTAQNIIQLVEGDASHETNQQQNSDTQHTQHTPLEREQRHLLNTEERKSRAEVTRLRQCVQSGRNSQSPSDQEDYESQLQSTMDQLITHSKKLEWVESSTAPEYTQVYYLTWERLLNEAFTYYNDATHSSVEPSQLAAETIVQHLRERAGRRPSRQPTAPWTQSMLTQRSLTTEQEDMLQDAQRFLKSMETIRSTTELTLREHLTFLRRVREYAEQLERLRLEETSQGSYMRTQYHLDPLVELTHLYNRMTNSNYGTAHVKNIIHDCTRRMRGLTEPAAPQTNPWVRPRQAVSRGRDMPNTSWQQHSLRSPPQWHTTTTRRQPQSGRNPQRDGTHYSSWNSARAQPPSSGSESSDSESDSASSSDTEDEDFNKFYRQIQTRLAKGQAPKKRTYTKPDKNGVDKQVYKDCKEAYALITKTHIKNPAIHIENIKSQTKHLMTTLRWITSRASPDDVLTVDMLKSTLEDIKHYRATLKAKRHDLGSVFPTPKEGYVPHLDDKKLLRYCTPISKKEDLAPTWQAYVQFADTHNLTHEAFKTGLNILLKGDLYTTYQDFSHLSLRKIASKLQTLFGTDKITDARRNLLQLKRNPDESIEHCTTRAETHIRQIARSVPENEREGKVNTLKEETIKKLSSPAAWREVEKTMQEFQKEGLTISPQTMLELVSMHEKASGYAHKHTTEANLHVHNTAVDAQEQSLEQKIINALEVYFQKMQKLDTDAKDYKVEHGKRGSERHNERQQDDQESEDTPRRRKLSATRRRDQTPYHMPNLEATAQKRRHDDRPVPMDTEHKESRSKHRDRPRSSSRYDDRRDHLRDRSRDADPHYRERGRSRESRDSDRRARYPSNGRYYGRDSYSRPRDSYSQTRQYNDSGRWKQYEYRYPDKDGYGSYTRYPTTRYPSENRNRSGYRDQRSLSRDRRRYQSEEKERHRRLVRMAIQEAVFCDCRSGPCEHLGLYQKIEKDLYNIQQGKNPN